MAAAVPHGESGGLASVVAWLQSDSRAGHCVLRHLLLLLGCPGAAGVEDEVEPTVRVRPLTMDQFHKRK